ncbi:MAG: winged helix-turn-helix transcriptional regulator [Chloroflexi bacterium]|nr:winged helix-turn-helix transcriptional regulator [Chloroflexota bacterium]
MSAEAAPVALLEPRMAQDLANLFQVLSDPTRVQIISALLGRELNVGEIAAALGLSLSAVSHQLRLLRNSRLVRWERKGREVYYLLDDEHIEVLYRAGLDHCCHM